MSSISSNPSLGGAKSQGDLMKELETELSSLPQGQRDYHLLSRIERLYNEVHQSERESGPLRSFFSWAASWISPNELGKIGILFDRALDRHGLSKINGQIHFSDLDILTFAENGDLPGLQFFLSEGRTLDQWTLNKLALAATENRYFDILKLLLTKGGAVTEICLGEMIRSAIRNRDSECLEFLLSQEASFGQRDLAEICLFAINGGYTQGLQILLSDGRSLREDDFDWAAYNAARIGDSESLQFLLSQGRINSQEFRNLIVIECASNSLLACLALILGQGPIERFVIERAIAQASGVYRDVIVEILRNELVTDHLPDDLYAFRASLEGFEIPSLEDVASNPLLYLDHITESGFPERIIVAGQSTLDLGGVSKEFIFTLFSSLASNLDLDRMSFPIPQREDKKDLFKKIGMLLSSLSAKNRERSDKFLIGCLFNKEFYQILKLALEKGRGQELNEVVAQILSSTDSSYQMTARLILHPENESFKQEYSQVMCCEMDEGDQIAKEEIESYSNAALWILEGADESLKDLIRSTSAETLCLTFQGEEATSEQIKAAIRVEEQTDLLEQQKAWLFEILDESDLDWRKKFLTYITGRDVLLPGGEPIRVRTTSREVPDEIMQFTFEAHTCFNSLDLPNMAFASKDDFLLQLNEEMEKKQYTIA